MVEIALGIIVGNFPFGTKISRASICFHSLYSPSLLIIAHGKAECHVISLVAWYNKMLISYILLSLFDHFPSNTVVVNGQLCNEHMST